MAEPVFFDARVVYKVATEAEWDDITLDTLIKGEFYFYVAEGDPNTVINIKVGDGVRQPKDLPYMWDASIRVPFFGSATPSSTPSPASGDGFWIATEAGTYTNYGGVVLPDNSFGIITRVGTTYGILIATIDLSGYVPVSDTEGNVVSEEDRLVTGNKIYQSIEEVYSNFGSVLNISRTTSFTLFGGYMHTDGIVYNSVNWISAQTSGLSPLTRYFITGFRAQTNVAPGATANAGRVICVHENGTQTVFPSLENTTSLDFIVPSGTVMTYIKLEANTNVGANPSTSPYNQTFKIYNYNESGIYEDSINGEYITGEINTEQISDMESKVDTIYPLFITSAETQTIPLTTVDGYMRDDGSVIRPSGVNYTRTSNTNVNVMIPYQIGKQYAYTGVLSHADAVGVLFFSSTGTVLGYYLKGSGNYVRSAMPDAPVGTSFIATQSDGGLPVIEILTTTIKPNALNLSNTIYIDSTYAGGDSDGTSSKPFTTINAAIATGTSNAKFIIKAGDYRESVNLSALPNGDYEFAAKVGDKVRILGSDKLTGFTKTAGYTNVYQVTTATPLNWSRAGLVIFEDGNPSMPILFDERHPLQKSLSNRLPFTVMKGVASLAILDTTPSSIFYSDGILYIHATGGTNPNSNGFSYEIPRRHFNTYPTYNTTKHINLVFKNIQGFFVDNGFRSVGFESVTRFNCSMLGVRGSGAFQDDTAIVLSYNDEAAYCNSDGFNGHFDAYTGYASLTDNRSMQPNATYFNPWAHDNLDDGMSHHENHFVQIYGGLVEYNMDGGVRGSNDSGFVVSDVISRRNVGDGSGGGIDVCNPTLNPNRNGCKMVAINCVSENNRIGYGCIGQDDNRIEIVNCISRNNSQAELLADAGKVISRNTLFTQSDPLKVKVTSGTGIITILNDTLLT